MTQRTEQEPLPEGWSEGDCVFCGHFDIFRGTGKCELCDEFQPGFFDDAPPLAQEPSARLLESIAELEDAETQAEWEAAQRVRKLMERPVPWDAVGPYHCSPL